MPKRKRTNATGQINLHGTTAHSDDEEDGLEDNGGGGSDVVSNFQNHIYFYGKVCVESAAELRKTLHQVNRKLTMNPYGLSPEQLTIFLHVNSPGGAAHCGLGLMDILQNNPVPITAIVEGLVGSAATFLVISCAYRQMTAHSLMLVHQCSGGIIGTYEDIKTNYINMKQVMKIFFASYTKYTKLTAEEIKYKLSNDREWTATKALKYGFIDEII